MGHSTALRTEGSVWWGWLSCWEGPTACGQHDLPQVGRCALLERNKAAALSPHTAVLCGSRASGANGFYCSGSPERSCFHVSTHGSKLASKERGRIGIISRLQSFLWSVSSCFSRLKQKAMEKKESLSMFLLDLGENMCKMRPKLSLTLAFLYLKRWPDWSQKIKSSWRCCS